jgi:apolipoprotein D and lipocalin family protein
MYFINIFLLFILSRISYSQLSVLNKPDTVSNLDINKYVGNWYQIYGAPTNVIFQGYGKCITAEYGLLENGNVSVLNSQLNSKDELEQISGYAYYTNISEPGKLTVHLDGVPVDSPYWVVKLGEVVNEQYQYTIISVPSGISLWVLARDVNQFYNNYDEEVLTYLDDNNFNYKSIVQDETCKYFF